MPTAELNGTTLNFETAGDHAGRPCLVLHGGLGVDHNYLRPAIDRLGDRLALVYVDHRGHGRSEHCVRAPQAGRPAEPPTVGQLADDADALATHLGHDRVLVLAHSWGGFVAQELALRHPERVAGLVLVASTAGELGADESLLDDLGPPIPVEADILVRVPPATDEELEATVRALGPYYLRGSDITAGDVFARCRFDAGAMVRTMHVLAAWSAADRLADVTAPALLVGGRHDVFCPPEQVARMARRMPRAEVAVLEESAHLPWLDEPDRFFPIVEEWLDRLR
jgi:proline iminopeptidase